MLTVLGIYQKSRREVIQQAETVEFAPLRYPPTPDIPVDSIAEADRQRYNKEDAGLLLVTGNNYTRLAFNEIGDEDYRDIFVMNEKGATVAKYTL